MPRNPQIIGSPPHMRGKALLTQCRSAGVGITPAHAGKSRCGEAFEYYDKDHPRTCGEKNLPAWNNQTLLGSPPHMRGKVPHVPVAAFAERITPAHAGKRLPVFSGYIRSQDHPRTCGEKKSHTITSRVCLGSPPHMRGKDQRAVRQAHGSRITPAHAGKRLKRSRSIVSHAAIVPLFPSVCNKPAGSDGSPAGHDAPPFLPIENAAPASPAYNLRSL